jgi:hypothetical protein
MAQLYFRYGAMGCGKNYAAPSGRIQLRRTWTKSLRH